MTQKYFNEIEFALVTRLWKRGLSANEAENAVYPLSWYVSTGRIPTEALKKIIDANSRQLTTISKRLMAGKSHDETIKHVMEYVNTI